MKKIILLLLTAVFIAAGVFSVNVYAADQPILLEAMFRDDCYMDIYLSRVNSNIVPDECLVGGVECEFQSGYLLMSSDETTKTIFLIDTTKSISKDIREKTKELMSVMIGNKTNSNNKYAICTLSAKSTMICDFTSDRYDLEKAMENIKYTGGSSYIYDGIKSYVKLLSEDDEVCYKRIIVITDGKESNTTGSTCEEVRDLIREHMITIDTVCIETPQNKEELKVLRSFSNLSNGVSVNLNENSDVNNIYSVLESNINSIYKAEYIVPKSVFDGGVKNIKFKYIYSDSINETALDIRVPMVKAAEGQVSGAGVGNALEENKNFVIIAAVTGVVLIIVIVLIVLIVKRERKKQNDPVPTQPENISDETEFLGFGDDGETALLFSTQDIFCVTLSDENNGKTFSFHTDKPVTIGRSAEASDIVIDYDKSLSKEHCRIYAEDDTIYIDDLNSSNKTYVNGIEVTQRDIVTDNCIIKMGRLSFRVSITKK